MEEGRTTKHDEGYGKRIVNLGLGWMQRQDGGEAKGKKKLPRSGSSAWFGAVPQRCLDLG